MKLLELIEGGFIAKFVNSIKKSVSISSGLAIINDIFSTAISGRKSLCLLIHYILACCFIFFNPTNKAPRGNKCKYKQFHIVSL